MIMPSSQSQNAPKPKLTILGPQPQVFGVTPRALLIGALLVPILCAWTLYTEIVAQSTELAVMSLSVGAVFALLVLLAINGALKRWLPRLAFTQAELVFIYIMQTVSIGISGV